MSNDNHYKVTAHALRVRNTASTNSTVIAHLKQGHSVVKVEELDKTTPMGFRWWQISATVDGQDVTGFVSSGYLTLDDEYQPPVEPPPIPAVHLAENLAYVTRNALYWAFPLGEAGRPERTAQDAAGKAAQLTQIVAWLDVEHSRRYQPQNQLTYCNIYAYDYCYLARAYLPRVWWSSAAIVALSNGQEVKPEYAKTVFEKNANALFDWLNEYGPQHGWTRIDDLSALQQAANDGRVAIICAKRRLINYSGHICAVVPETGAHRAQRTGGVVTHPLQSEAGADNRRYVARMWWGGTKYSGVGFYVHD